MSEMLRGSDAAAALLLVLHVSLDQDPLHLPSRRTRLLAGLALPKAIPGNVFA